MKPLRTSTCRELALAALHDSRDNSLTFWWERWSGTGSYWKCEPGMFHV